jgi:hypothetical protein
MDFGKYIEASAAHPQKAEPPIVAILHGGSNFTDSSSPLISENDAGMTVDLSEKQPEKIRKEQHVM